jgi:hypothetical protein
MFEYNFIQERNDIPTSNNAWPSVRPYSQASYPEDAEDNDGGPWSSKNKPSSASQKMTEDSILDNQSAWDHLLSVYRRLMHMQGHRDAVANIQPAHIIESGISSDLRFQQQCTTANEISYAVINCLKVLSNVLSDQLLQSSECLQDVPLALWQDELGRFRVWAANIGAHQTGRSGLDHRLRDASDIKKQILQLLNRLQRLIQDLKELLDTPDVGIEEFSESEEDATPESEMQSIYHALHDTISNLFDMSVVIRRPAQHDRFLGIKRSDAVFYEPFDKQHVKSKYPNADESILDRLGSAISQRRAILRYRERHHHKLAQGLNTLLGDDAESTRLSETVATEFFDPSEEEVKDAWETNSQSAVSQTSYAETILHCGDGIALPPRPKESADGNLFECPFCFEITSVKSDVSWARHVFSDLMPYVCIFPGCATPHRLYESRREWYFHSQDMHSITENPDKATKCPLCLIAIPSGKQCERHVARHLQELALFALPRFDQQDVDSVVSGESQKAALGDLLGKADDSDNSDGDQIDEPSRPDEIAKAKESLEELKKSFQSKRSTPRPDEFAKAIESLEELKKSFQSKRSTPPHSSTSAIEREQERYQCLLCDIQKKGNPLMLRFGSLKRHLSTIHEISDSEFRCLIPDCTKAYYRRDRMREHLTFIHKKQDLKSADVDATRVRRPPPITCTVCSEAINSWDAFFGHMKQHCLIRPESGKSRTDSD